jgi:hypothetical protein
MITKTNTTTQAVEFLQTLRPTGPWTLSAIVPDGPITTASFKGEAAVPKMAEWIASHCGKANLYFIPNRTRKRVTKKPTEADMATMDFAQSDLDAADGESPTDAAKRHRAALEAHDPPPTLVWSSGNGIQALWKLRHPLTLETAADIENGKAINRALAERLGGDHCQSLDHLFRLPGTPNLPNAAKQAKGRTVTMAGDVTSYLDRTYCDFELPAVADAVASTCTVQIGAPVEVALPDHIKTLVNAGPTADRSKQVFGAIAAMIHSDFSNEQILGVLLHQDYPITERIFEKPNPEQYARDEFIRARAKVVKTARAEEDFGVPDAATRWQAMNIDELLALPSPVWLVEGLFVERGLFEIFGKFKSGKTFWGIEITCCIATGHDFFGAKVALGKLLYIIAEGTKKLFGYRLREWCKERSKDKDGKPNRAEYERLHGLVKDNLQVVAMPLLVDLPEQVKAFLKVHPTARKLVVLDTVFRTASGDVMKPDVFQKYVAGCDHIRRTLETAVLFLHHQRRNEAQGAFGSVVQEASVDSAVKISRPRKGYTAMHLDIIRDGDLDVPAWTCKIDKRLIPEANEGEVGTVGVLVYQGKGPADKYRALLETIRRHELDTVDDLTRLTPGTASKPTVERRLAKLRKDGFVAAGELRLTDLGITHITQDDFSDADEED